MGRAGPGAGLVASPNTRFAASAGSRASSTGDLFLGPRLNRSPTITIFPGAVIDVFCNKDLILPGAYHENAGISPVIVQR